jgi:hypothetical protein
MIPSLLYIGIAIIVLGYLLGLMGQRGEAAAAGTTEAPDAVTITAPEMATGASTQAGDARATDLQEAGAILLRVGILVALVGLVGWDLLRFLLSLVGGVLTPG